MACSALCAVEVGELKTLSYAAAAVGALDALDKALRILLFIIHSVVTTFRFDN